MTSNLHLINFVIACFLLTLASGQSNRASKPTIVGRLDKFYYGCAVAPGDGYLYLCYSNTAAGKRSFVKYTITLEGLSNPTYIDFGGAWDWHSPPVNLAITSAGRYWYWTGQNNRACVGDTVRNVFKCATASGPDDEFAGWKTTVRVYLDEARHRMIHITEDYIHTWNVTDYSITELPGMRISRPPQAGGWYWNTYWNVASFNTTTQRLLVGFLNDMYEFNYNLPNSSTTPTLMHKYQNVAKGTPEYQKSAVLLSNRCWLFYGDSGYPILKRWCPETNTVTQTSIMNFAYAKKICEDVEEKTAWLFQNNDESQILVFDYQTMTVLGHTTQSWDFRSVTGCYAHYPTRRMYVAHSSFGIAVYLMHWVSTVTPQFLNPNGGTIVTVTGRGFRNTPDLACIFDGIVSLSPSTGDVTFVSSSLIYCRSPPLPNNRLDNPRVAIEVAIDSMNTTANGVTTMYQGIPWVSYTTPTFLTLAGTPLITINGFSFVDAGADLKCKFGSSDTMYPATYVDSRAVLCSAPTRPSPTKESVFVTYNNGRDWSDSSGSLYWVGPPAVLIVTGSPTFFALNSSCTIAKIRILANDSRGVFVGSTDSINRTVTLSSPNSTLAIGNITTAVMSSGEAIFNDVFISGLEVGRYALMLSTPGLPASFLWFEIGACPKDPENYPPGFYLRSTSCAPCEPGTYKYFTGPASCIKCPDNTDTGGAYAASSSDQCICKPGYFSETGQPPCTACPVGAVCPGGDKITALAGYWRASFSSTDFYPCESEASCQPGPPISLSRVIQNPLEFLEPPVACSPGSFGPLCSVCQDGFAKEGGYCLSCPSRPANVAAVFFICIAAIAGIVVLVRATLRDCKMISEGHTKNTNLTSVLIKIFINYMQLNSLALLMPVRWPQFLVDLLSSEKSSSGPSINITSVTCAAQWGVRGQTIFLFVLPFFIILLPVLISGIYFLVINRKQVFGNINFSFFARIKIKLFSKSESERQLPDPQDGDSEPNKQSPRQEEEEEEQEREENLPTFSVKELFQEFVEDHWNTYVVYLLVTLFLVHPTITEKAVQNMRCEDIAGTPFMAVDRSFQCWTPQHQPIFALSVLMFVLWSFGIPMFALGLLYYHRKSLGEPEVQMKLGFLYISYRCGPKFVAPSGPAASTKNLKNGIWFFEILITLRKVFVIFAVEIFRGSVFSQGQMVSWVILLAFIAQSVLRPFVNKLQNNMETVALFFNYLTIQGALLYVSELSDSEKLGVTVGLVIANFSIVITFVVLILRAVVEQFREMAHQMDKDGDGKVSREELKAALWDFMGIPQGVSLKQFASNKVSDVVAVCTDSMVNVKTRVSSWIAVRSPKADSGEGQTKEAWVAGSTPTGTDENKGERSATPPSIRPSEIITSSQPDPSNVGTEMQDISSPNPPGSTDAMTPKSKKL